MEDIAMELDNLQNQVEIDQKFTYLHQNQNYIINKDSVHTSISTAIHIGIKRNERTNLSANSNFYFKQTQQIKKKNKKALQLLRNKNVLQTLKNITKNIKSQIKQLTNKDNGNKQNQPQLNLVENIESTIIEIIPTNHCQQNKNRICEQNISSQNPLIVESQINESNVDCSLSKPEKLFLFSMKKGVHEQFNVFADSEVIFQKQLRNLTISRIVDNDLSSDEQEIKMGVNYMYYQLLNSCKKQEDKKRQSSKMISSKKKVVNQGNRLMNNVKQKLIF